MGRYCCVCSQSASTPIGASEVPSDGAGVVEVPDERLPVLAKIVQTEKIVPAAIEFYDIAGLVNEKVIN